MDYDCHCDHESYGGVHTLKEHDIGLQFDDVKIAAKDMTPATTVDASSWSAKGDFLMHENGWTGTDPNCGIACQGKFAKGGPAPVLSAGSGWLDSHFLVEAMKTFKIDGVTGSHCPGLAHYHPLWPISVISPDKTIPPQRFIEDMMTAPVKVDLSLLRHMKVGDGPASRSTTGRACPRRTASSRLPVALLARSRSSSQAICGSSEPAESYKFTRAKPALP